MYLFFGGLSCESQLHYSYTTNTNKTNERVAPPQKKNSLTKKKRRPCAAADETKANNKLKLTPSQSQP